MTTHAIAGQATRCHSEQNEEQLKSTVAQILDEATKQGATDAEVAVSDEIAIGVDVRDRDLETVEFHQSGALGITVFIGHSTGTASTSDTSQSAIQETVAKALAIAKYTQPDECQGLADKDRMATEFPNLGLFYDDPIDLEELKNGVLAGEAAALDYDPRIMPSDGSSASAVSTCFVYGNTHGFLQGVRSSRHVLRVEALAKDESGMQQDSWWTSGHNADSLDSSTIVGEKAAQRALQRLGAKPIQSGKYPILFDALSAGILFSNILAGISGGSLYRRASYLCDSLGTQVAIKDLSLVEYPHLVGGVGSQNFDSEGVQTTEKAFIEDGTVTNYVLGSYSARRLGMETTGNANGCHNLVVEAPRTDPEDLFREMNTGLVVTRTMSQGANLVTGDFSSGAAGYWVENGQRTHAVENLTIASTMNDIFSGLIGFGDDVEKRLNLQTGSVLVDSMTVAAS